MAKNRMQRIAGIFGKELEEPFTVRAPGMETKQCKFSEVGFYRLGDGQWWLDTSTFMKLCEGEAEIVREKNAGEVS